MASFAPALVVLVIGIATFEVIGRFQVSRGWVEHTRQVRLGLAISRELARGMGGDLWAESTVGVGSTFVLALRRADGGATEGSTRGSLQESDRPDIAMPNIAMPNVQTD